MAETVKLPGIKQPLPKWGVAAGVGGVGVAIVLYYRNKKTQPAPTSTDQYPPDGTVGNPSDPYSTDPATGQTYGDEAAGSGGTFGAFTGLGNSGAGWDPNTGIYTDPNGNTCTNPGADGYCPGSSGGGPPFSTNAAWSTWVIQQLQTLNPSLNVGQLTDALGLYLAGEPVDPGEKSLILDAEAVGGPPPVAGPNGYPPKIRLNGNKGGGGAKAHNPVTGLKATVRYTQADLRWNPAKNATSYRVIVKDSRQRVQTQTTTGTSITLHDLSKRDKYTVQVLALPADKTAYAHEARTTFETK